MSYYERSAPRYRDREDAGRVLASRLLDYKGHDLAVLAIPNGGVPVGRVMAEELDAGLYLMIVRKLQIPHNPEAGFGAVTSDGFLLLNQGLVNSLGLTEKQILKQKQRAMKSIRERQLFFGRHAQLPDLKDRTIIVVDDGLASGFTMEAAVKSLETRHVRGIIIAVPTSSMTAHRRLESKVDRIICPDLSRLRVFAVADAYEDWYDLDEKEVLRLLEETNHNRETRQLPRL